MTLRNKFQLDAAAYARRISFAFFSGIYVSPQNPISRITDIGPVKREAQCERKDKNVN